MMTMLGATLGELLKAVPEHSVKGPLSVRIYGYTYDSRTVPGPGILFAAFEGSKHDGHDYIDDALANGAAALVVSRPVEGRYDVPVVTVPDSRRALAYLARELYDDPSSKLFTVGLTGTKGKTTTTRLLLHLLDLAGVPSGLVGTMGYRVAAPLSGLAADPHRDASLNEAELIPAPNTTPEGADLQRLFYSMVTNGLTHVVMEVSSHALALGRAELLKFDLAGFTNLGHDHMDFHPDVQHYAASKALLFSSIKPGGTAVVNSDDPFSVAMAKAAKATGARVVTVGLGPSTPAELAGEPSLRASEIELSATGSSFVVTSSSTGERVRVETGLVGIFNVSNCLMALALASEAGLDLGWAGQAVRSFSGVPGRFQPVNAGQPFSVIVDYAHNPDSLRNVLATARGLSAGRLISVFGCGGDRDRTKRPVMGAISREIADYTVVTSDNPRTEDPAAIVAEIAAGMGDPDPSWTVILDRREAIRHAVGVARPGDVVVIAGKGHETYQILHDRAIHFDDVEEARAAIEELTKGV